MAIVKMKRLRLIALQSEREELMTRLIHVGCVEITEPEEELASPLWMELLHRDTNTSSEQRTEIATVTAALEALRKYAPVKSGLFEKRSIMQEADFFQKEALADAMRHAEEIKDGVSAIARLYTESNSLRAQRASLVPWTNLDLPLEESGTIFTDFLMGACPLGMKLSELQSDLAGVTSMAEVIPAGEDAEQQYLLLVCHKSVREEIGEILRKRAFSPIRFKDLSGTAAENIAKIDGRLTENEARRLAEEEKIQSHAEARQTLKYALDRLQQDLSKEMARERLLTNGTIVFLEGWSAENGRAKLEEELAKFTCAFEFSDPEEGDAVPTLLDNPEWMDPINMVTEMYSLPAYHGIDPDPLIFGFFIVFFGFMFADIGYGIILTVLSAVITKVYAPKYTIGRMFRLGIYLGISTIFWGFITGGFFGDVITVFSENFLGMENVHLPYLLNPLQNPMTVLIVAIIMGIIQLLFGQCVHIYMECRDGRVLSGFLDVVPWWIVFAGIAMAALGHGATLILVGAIVLVLTQGRDRPTIPGKIFGGFASLYDITSWLSDVLSYSRLMALMLATTVIASVMNILGSLPGNLFVFILVFLIGHVFNIGVNIIGTYVHAARLQYLEFFGKFYKEGGIPFRPLAYQTKYVDIAKEEN